ncbi:MAG: hypothetical protein COX19_13595 [Desulfobacterales bacterium CG23_combo_of_CG06-09_8_20_14_all_51_8]|nr:MAG: hypothetical protein COX19_13595 [Desulfobacterales bacterium CG23_combo_of_CG06-09_8_20_14_all_51_8]
MRGKIRYDDVPQLPTGYAGMIVLALIPPLWRKIMDPRVLKFRRKQNKEGEDEKKNTTDGNGAQFNAG